ncbi:7 transmembrane sweet-taste receptor of 3 GCPR [Nitzschia inconspicua]|uniref:7 transmembrane sweet-taste receptor of 3 GCPR n=1 Tax=Nitzschia inconspicua TaxID=303405 RepID=A0A9K3KZ04_9STRA|nr:7 transmembrane sweet-taste receptor of 3 GCPR [Nitzschia inconspicua]
MTEECCASCGPSLDTTSDSSTNSTPKSLSILTWAQSKSVLEAYADMYQQQFPDEPKIRVVSVPSLQDLNAEVNFEFQHPSGVYDGFVVPPMLLGDMYQKHGGTGLAVFDKEYVDELLPYYKYQVAMYDGAIRSMPLFSGSQLLLLFRKDYLDQKNLPTPKTWSDYVRIAAVMHNEPLGTGGQPIYGSCMGRLSQESCRRKDGLSTTGSSPCHSQSMSYLGMMLSSMTQVGGNRTGWMLGVDETTPTGLDPLFQPTLETILLLMERQIRFGAPDELTEDASLNLRLFQEGLCAMTVTAEHDVELLKQSDVGFVPLPGFQKYLLRGEDEMVDCTKESCPSGLDFEKWGRVNVVPFAATDATVGVVSAHVVQSRQEHAKKFFQFAMSSSDLDSTAFRRQPLTHSQLKKSTVPGYGSTIESLTNNSNAATPFRIPNAFELLSDLDNRVYEYLIQGDYSTDSRQRMAQSAEKSWQTSIRMYDARGLGLPSHVFHAKSIGSYVPETASEIYIGSGARGIGWGLGGLSCLASLWLALWVVKNRNERVIRASQPIFLLMVCLGTFVMASSIFPFGIEDDLASYKGCSIACMAALWCFCIGFAITFSVLFSKIWLVISVLRVSRGKQRIKMTRRDIFLPNMFLYTINVAALLTWTLTNPQSWTRIPINEEASHQNLVQESTRGWCGSSQTMMYLGIILGANLVMMIVSLIQAYECRKIATEYSESLWISASIAVIAQVWIVGLPILKLVDDNPRGVFLTKVGIIFVSTSSTLLLIFGPKMGYHSTAMAEKKYEQQVYGARSSFSSEDQPVIDTSETQSHSEEESPNNPHNASKMSRTSKPRIEPLGIRIIPACFVHSQEADKLQMAVDKAERRNRSLQSTLETLQEKMEQYIIARDPLGGLYNNGASGTVFGSTENQGKLARRQGSILASRPEVLLSKSIHGLDDD